MKVTQIKTAAQPMYKNIQKLFGNFELRDGNELLSTRLTLNNGEKEIGHIIDSRIVGNRAIVESGKAKIELDYATGDVISFAKGRFQSQNTAIKKLTAATDFAAKSENFVNPEKVKHFTLRLLTMSKETFKRLIEAQATLSKKG